MPFAAPTVSPPTSETPEAFGKNRQAEIVTIPEKFYGMALKMKPPFAMDQMAPKPVVAAPVPKPALKIVQPPPRKPWTMIAIIVGVILLVALGFLYFGRDFLFPKPAPAPVTVVQQPEVPPAPSEVTASANAPGSISLQWKDVSDLETGYRIERREMTGTYMPLTTLPANSTVFLDTSVQDGATYQYRVIAMGANGESAPSNETGATAQTAPLVAPVVVTTTTTVQAAPTLPPGGLDSDSDGLSDVEEALYGTDSHNPDTDGDGFLDGNEVFHLYSPTVKAPSHLIDSGMVRNWKAPAGWQMYVPGSWQTSLDQPDGSRATITSGHGETFTIAIEDNSSHMALLDWYLNAHPGITSADVRLFTTKRGLEGLMGQDRLDAYFAWDGKVFSLTYHLDGQTYINFRTTYEMMLNSLRLVGAPQVTAPPEAMTGPGSFVGALGTTTSTPAPATVPPPNIPAPNIQTPPATSIETPTTTASVPEATGTAAIPPPPQPATTTLETATTTP